MRGLADGRTVGRRTADIIRMSPGRNERAFSAPGRLVSNILLSRRHVSRLTHCPGCGVGFVGLVRRRRWAVGHSPRLDQRERGERGAIYSKRACGAARQQPHPQPPPRHFGSDRLRQAARRPPWTRAMSDDAGRSRMGGRERYRRAALMRAWAMRSVAPHSTGGDGLICGGCDADRAGEPAATRVRQPRCACGAPHPLRCVDCGGRTRAGGKRGQTRRCLACDALGC